MALKDLDGRRTGRPRGARTSSRVRRDILWAYAHLDKQEAKPPSAGARLWATLAREEPALFLVCLANLEAGVLDAENRHGATRGPAGRDPGVAGCLSGGGPENGIGVGAVGPQRVQRLFLPVERLVPCLEGSQRVRITNLPSDCMRIVAGEVDRAGRGVLLTIESGLFAEVPAGAPVPVFQAEWLRDPRAPD